MQRADEGQRATASHRQQAVAKAVNFVYAKQYSAHAKQASAPLLFSGKGGGCGNCVGALLSCPMHDMVFIFDTTSFYEAQINFNFNWRNKMASYDTNRPCPNCRMTGTSPARCLNCGTVGCDFCVAMPPSGVNQKWKVNCKICNSEQEVMSLA